MADVKIPLLGKTLSEIQGIVHGLGHTVLIFVFLVEMGFTMLARVVLNS